MIMPWHFKVVWKCLRVKSFVCKKYSGFTNNFLMHFITMWFETPRLVSAYCFWLLLQLLILADNRAWMHIKLHFPLTLLLKFLIFTLISRKSWIFKFFCQNCLLPSSVTISKSLQYLHTKSFKIRSSRYDKVFYKV